MPSKNTEGRSLSLRAPLVCYKIKVLKSTRNINTGVPFIDTDQGLMRLALRYHPDDILVGHEYFAQTIDEKHSWIPIQIVDLMIIT